MLEPGPVVVGGMGGSGTGLVARILQAGGIHMGGPLNPSWDALTFLETYHKWVEVWSVAAGRRFPEPLWREMVDEFGAAIQAHRKTCRPGRWGWKLTGAIHFVGLIDQVCRIHGTKMTFVHVLRDGRDVAYSRTQQQFGDHGEALLAGRTFSYPSAAKPEMTVGRRMAFWSLVNERAADEGERLAPFQHIQVVLERLVQSPLDGVDRILKLLKIDAAPEPGAALVGPLPTMNRWRDAPLHERMVLDAVGARALHRFGYASLDMDTEEHTIGGRPPLDPSVPEDLEVINKLVQRDLRPGYPMNPNE